MNELAHHGILGMKWGVRRYQNFDGSYTKKGLERYRKAETEYYKAKEAFKNGTGQKQSVRAAKKELNKAYDHLALDKKADQGKKLYQQGKTISSNNSKMYTAAKIATGTAAVSTILARNGDYELAALATQVGMGISAANVILGIKTESDNRKLRAYYAHGR